MKIVAIASMPLDLELACFGTLARCIKDGHELHIIIAKANRDKAVWTQMKMETLSKVSNMIGVSQVHFTDRFDYSAVTQDNANVLASFLKKIDPSLVIMPFWKASNQWRKILAKTSLVACRGIGSVLMYELERNTNFLPTVYFEVSADEISKKTACLAEYASLITEPRARSKANCFNLDLSTMKKYQFPLLQETSALITNTVHMGTTMPRNSDQQLIFTDNANANELEKLGYNDYKKSTHRKVKQLLHRHSSLEGHGNILVEVFESHRMLLVNSDDAS